MVRNTRVDKFSERTLQSEEHRFPQARLKWFVNQKSIIYSSFSNYRMDGFTKSSNVSHRRRPFYFLTKSKYRLFMSK